MFCKTAISNHCISCKFFPYPQINYVNSVYNKAQSSETIPNSVKYASNRLAWPTEM